MTQTNLIHRKKKMTTSTPTPTPETTREQALSAAYATATKKLRDAHRTEFNTMYQAEAKALGHDWTPRPTAEEKAEQQMLDLLAAHPALAETLADKITKA